MSYFVAQLCTCSLATSFWYTLLKLLAIFKFYSCCFNWTRIYAASLRIILSVIFAKNLFCVIHHNSPKYHISTAWAKRSGANAWASAHAISMVMWYNQKIVVGQCLVVYTLELWLYGNLKYWVMSWCCTCNLSICWGVILSYSCILSTHYIHFSKSQLQIFSLSKLACMCPID